GVLQGGGWEAHREVVETSILPFVRARYGLAAARDQTFVAGTSLGGLSALLFALRAPHLVDCAIAMSPSLGWGAYGDVASGALVHRWPDHTAGAPRLYLDS